MLFCRYAGWSKKYKPRFFFITASDIGGFSKYLLSHSANKVIIKDTTKLEMRRYTTLWNDDVSVWIINFTMQCSEIFSDYFFTNLLLSVPMKELRNLVATVLGHPVQRYTRWCPRFASVSENVSQQEDAVFVLLGFEKMCLNFVSKMVIRRIFSYIVFDKHNLASSLSWHGHENWTNMLTK